MRMFEREKIYLPPPNLTKKEEKFVKRSKRKAKVEKVRAFFKPKKVYGRSSRSVRKGRKKSSKRVSRSGLSVFRQFAPTRKKKKKKVEFL